MKQEVLAYLPLISPVATLVVVMLGFFFQNRHVDTRLADLTRYMDGRFGDVNPRFSDISKLITAESARLEAVLRLEIAKLDFRIKAPEDRAALVYRP